jgi:hypothetical protein
MLSWTPPCPLPVNGLPCSRRRSKRARMFPR